MHYAIIADRPLFRDIIDYDYADDVYAISARRSFYAATPSRRHAAVYSASLLLRLYAPICAATASPLFNDARRGAAAARAGRTTSPFTTPPFAMSHAYGTTRWRLASRHRSFPMQRRNMSARRSETAPPGCHAPAAIPTTPEYRPAPPPDDTKSQRPRVALTKDAARRPPVFSADAAALRDYVHTFAKIFFLDLFLRLLPDSCRRPPPSRFSPIFPPHSPGCHEYPEAHDSAADAAAQKHAIACFVCLRRAAADPRSFTHSDNAMPALHASAAATSEAPFYFCSRSEMLQAIRRYREAWRRRRSRRRPGPVVEQERGYAERAVTGMPMR